MGIEVKKVRSDSENYICSTENEISLNPKEEKEKLIILITPPHRGEISILCIFCKALIRN